MSYVICHTGCGVYALKGMGYDNEYHIFMQNQSHPLLGRRLAGVSTSITGRQTSSGRGPHRRSHTRIASSYDHPALYTSEDAFSEATYWDRRYRDERHFEWYRGYASLAPVLLQVLKPDKPLLQVGVGTSTLQLDMVQEAGFEDIVNLDYSAVCVERMAAAHAHVPQLRYIVGDVRRMHGMRDGAFAGVLDKGTLDALLCGDTADEDADLMLNEVLRVLEPGGTYVMITSHAPLSRHRYLCRPWYRWEAVHVYEVGQQRVIQGPYALPMSTASAAMSTQKAGSASPSQLHSPPELTAEQLASVDALGLPRQPYSHFAYVCRKSSG